MKDGLEEFIQNNQDGFDRKTPDPAMLGKIMEQMAQKQKAKPEGIIIPFQAIRWAAVVLTLITFGTTFWMLQKKTEPIVEVKLKAAVEQQTAKFKPPVLQQAGPVEVTGTKTQKNVNAAFAEQDLKERKRAVLARLKEQSNYVVKQVLFAGLSDMNSPASRIKAVSGAHKLVNSSNDIVDALVQTLNTDPNANVRLAALDGLNRFYRESYVRKKLLASLRKQQDPVVQIALINLLTRIRESGILEELEKMASDENTEKAVKDCAYSGIIRLQSS